ncbi:MAG: AarF/ABC1/UbiB kinase family protein [Actinomycetota bacterium]|nr:AarF/ABC1/UbiB kinase family protein [Actinomycetota bacterium]
MTVRQQRYREIAETLSRHGMGYVVDMLGLDQQIPFHHGLLGHERRTLPYTRPEHVRLALEQLGATFVKLGQILSTRSDLLGPEYQVEFAKLQDSAPPVPGEAICNLIAEELSQGVEEAFATFDAVPLAAASIGQAHAATRHDGIEVVVKVRRPGVVEQVAVDLEILRNLARHTSRHWQAAADYDIVGLVDEFATTLQGEMDYLREGRNAERFTANFARDPDVHIPRVFWETTTSRVLTLERIHGLKINDMKALDQAGIDRHALAELATRVTAQMVFEDGFFHADPHPGNFFIEPSGRLGIIDFGMVGELDQRLREQLGALLVALARSDPGRVTDAVLALSTAQQSVNRSALREDLAALIARNDGLAISEIALAPLIEDALAIVRRHHLQLPHELALLLKMFVMNEGMAVGLDPGFRPGDVLAPYARRLITSRRSAASLARDLGEAGIDIAQLGTELPHHLRKLLTVLDDGGLEVHLRAAELEPLVTRAERLGNRLIAGVITAAFINGTAELMTLDAERRRSRQRPALAFGVAAAGALSGYLAWTSRPGRHRFSPLT